MSENVFSPVTQYFSPEDRQNAIYWTVYLTDIVAAGVDHFAEDLSHRVLSVLTIRAHTLVCRGKLRRGVLRLPYKMDSMYAAVKQRLGYEADYPFLTPMCC